MLHRLAIRLMMPILLVLLSLVVLLSNSARVQSINQLDNNWILRESTIVPSPFLSSQKSLPAARIDPNGTIYTTQILKRQLADELKLPLRDLRIVDPSLPSQIKATFVARPNAILLCVENIKIILKNDEALVFSPYQPDIQEFLPALQQQIINAAVTDGVDSEYATLRFEHTVIEAALNVACNKLFRKVRSISPSVEAALKGLGSKSKALELIETQVDQLLPLKNQLDELRKRVKELKRAITEVLSDDETLEMMYLKPAKFNSDANSGNGNSNSYSNSNSNSEVIKTSTVRIHEEETVQEIDSQEELRKATATMSLEILFENYLNEVEWISAEVEDMLDEITNTEENVVLQMELLQNRILRFELLLSVGSFVITFGALVTGLFGMNLLSHLETNPIVFYLVTALLATAMLAMYTSMTRYGRREKLF